MYICTIPVTTILYLPKTSTAMAVPATPMAPALHHTQYREPISDNSEASVPGDHLPHVLRHMIIPPTKDQFRSNRSLPQTHDESCKKTSLLSSQVQRKCTTYCSGAMIFFIFLNTFALWLDLIWSLPNLDLSVSSSQHCFEGHWPRRFHGAG